MSKVTGRLAITLVLLASALVVGKVSSAYRADAVGVTSTTITFVVTVPKNTPSGDAIYMENHQSNGIRAYRMKKAGSWTYRISFSPNELSRGTDGRYHYRYVRNRAGFHGAEHIAPDDFAYREKHLGRSIPFSQVLAGGVQRDTIRRLRWFPHGNQPIKRRTALEPSGPILPRVNNTPFRSGQGIIDYWTPEFDPFVKPTARHLKSLGYGWAAIFPPWQWIKQDPLPVAGNERELGLGESPNYPNDAKLLGHLRAFRRAGLKVHLAPQLCCTTISTKDRSQAWWWQYFSEVERFILHHARLAQKARVDSFMVDLFDAQQSGLPDLQSRIDGLVRKVREVYKGELGTIMWIGGETPETASIYPSVNELTMVKDIDFYMAITTASISTSEAPTDEELKVGTGKVLDVVKELYETTGKPTIILLQSYGVQKAWKGDAYIRQKPIPGAGDNAARKKFHRFSSADQARTVHAYFEALRDRPWITGLWHFGYEFWEYPLLPDWSIRGEPAEDVFRKWNRVAYCPRAERTFPAGAYTGPLIDTHIHIAPLPENPSSERPLGTNDQPIMGNNVTVPDYVCMLDVEKTNKIFAFFPVWEPIIRQHVGLVKKTLNEYPGRFVPFIMPPDSDNDPGGFPTVAASKLNEMLKVYPGLFQGYGEIGLYAREGGAAELPPDSQRLKRIYPVVRKNKLAVYFHLGQGHQDEFERVLEKNPDINFIWHGDQLITGSGAGQDLSVIEGILSRHPNAYYGVDELYGDVWLLRRGVSQETFLKHFQNPEPLLEQDLVTWKGFIERHPNQVLWGTDRGGDVRWSLDPEVALTLNDYSRTFIGRLDPSVQEKFAYKNAEALMGASP